MTNFIYIAYLIASILLPKIVFSADEVTKCETCQHIINTFKSGLVNTSKQNFGGGNTDWEETRLGSYANSETRLISIIENLCKGASNDKKCHAMVEENEESIEQWWFSIFKSDPTADLYEHLCITSLKICCPNNHFGAKCTLCKGIKSDAACLGNGVCNGNGTRTGDGACNCSTGYEGEICDECSEGHFYTKTDSNFECKACHESCKGGCSGNGALKCEACKTGWIWESENGCSDINECAENNGYGNCSTETQYCENNEGSFTCVVCNAACSGCFGPGAEKCKSCYTGYELSGTVCQDINECSADSSLCRGQNEHCQNTPGNTNQDSDTEDDDAKDEL